MLCCLQHQYIKDGRTTRIENKAERDVSDQLALRQFISETIATVSLPSGAIWRVQTAEDGMLLDLPTGGNNENYT